jgi:hypothetical protein
VAGYAVLIGGGVVTWGFQTARERGGGPEEEEETEEEEEEEAPRGTIN